MEKREQNGMIIGIVSGKGTLLAGVQESGNQCFWGKLVDSNLVLLASRKPKGSVLHKVEEWMKRARQNPGAGTTEILGITDTSRNQRERLMGQTHSKLLFLAGQDFMYYRSIVQADS